MTKCTTHETEACDTCLQILPNGPRVSERVAEVVMDFWRDHVNQGEKSLFHAVDLENYVNDVLGMPTAPGTPGRALRHLRKKGYLNYHVMKAHESLYIALPNTSGPLDE